MRLPEEVLAQIPEGNRSAWFREAVEEKLAAGRRLPAAGDLGVGERPAAPGPKRERRSLKSKGRVAHERGARGGGLIETEGAETLGPGNETTEPAGEAKGAAGETEPAGAETLGPRVRRCKHGKRIWVEGLVALPMDCVEPRCREEAGLA